MTMEGVGRMSGLPARLAIALALPIAFVMSGLIHAQAPAPVAPRQTTAAGDRLPVRRVVLYKSGVGYFEHLGKVRGNQQVTIDFTSGQLDDVLKSLTTLDLDGGRVAGVSYNSDASLDRRLSALRLPLGEQTTRAQFLSALRGARLEVRTPTARFVGRLLSVERFERRSNGDVTTVDAVALVSDAGDIQTIPLDPGVSVRIAETDLNQEVSRYLTAVASVRDQDLRRLTIATTGTGERDLFVSYVSEVPVWKATYRLVLPSSTETRKPLLQGWAIVDNTVGEDWENVELSLVAGAPQSFIQQISRPYYMQRPVVPLPQRALMSPQTHQSALATSGAGALAGAVTDPRGGAMPGVTVQLARGGVRVADTLTDSPSGRYRLSGIAPGLYDITFALSGFRPVVRSGVSVSGGMETVLNATMEVGGVSETVSVTAASPTVPPPSAPAFRGGAGGRGQGFADANRIDQARAEQQADATAAQLGDLFAYNLKERVTIRKNQSALVPILATDVEADKVSLWNPTSGSRALRAVWLTNATGLTLDGGSFSVIEGQAFSGEGLMEPLKAGERRLLSYALDLGLIVDAKGENVPTRITKVRIANGLVIQETEERQARTYTVRNEDTEPRVLVLEHPARAGWSLANDLKATESTPAWHRFRVPIPAKTTATFTVQEVRPIQTQYQISSITDDQIALLVREQAITPAIEAALKEVLKRKAEIARLAAEMGTRQAEIDQIARDQDRVRENMRTLKGSSEERQLLQRYVKQLDDQENRLAVLRKELQDLTAQRQKAQDDLNRYIEGLGADQM
ncbi:MAG TPA: carboxypeptidase regulatory-like domain-containing protein [Vicinamibacterales bacterium]|nr:carboxypeptidase regulatory-like domain-containing protein [Vicinamibacterales bacterium]